ncbi:hypothetical protein BS47DRAFT_1358690 [Hydnum rufescens UP504]|uniref:Uncharacterized protein n=1 Tax=Hydnum rufescens UP504 TaxID=1448309 RepID=A0A9P6B7I2_9AGAM|nr:hypothetical protein BS47DRAFT_1358690 [Hydnum rufescens UP504]
MRIEGLLCIRIGPYFNMLVDVRVIFKFLTPTYLALFRDWQSPALISSDLPRPPSTRRCHIPAGRGCVALLDPFSLCETPAELSTDEAQGEIRGRTQPPRTPTLVYPQPPQRRIKYGAAHLLRRVCGNLDLGPFSLRETDPKNAQTASTTKYGSAQPPKTPTRTLYDNKTSTAPHTRRSGDLHYMIPDPTNAQARLRAKHGSVQPPRPPDPQVSATYTTTNQIRCQTPASAGVWHDEVLSPSTKPDKAEIRARMQPLKTPASDSHDLYGSNTVPHTRFGGSLPFPTQKPARRGHDQPQHDISCAAQAPSAWPPNTTINQTLYHTPASAGVITSGLPSLILSESEDPTQGPSPKRPQLTRRRIKHGTTHPLQQPTHEATLPRAQIHQSARISRARDLIQPTTAPSPKQNPADKDTTRKPATRLTEHPQE